MDFIYGRLTNQLKLVEYTGLTTDTAQTVVNNDDSNTIAVNVIDAIINNKSLKNSILPDIYSRLDEGSSDISSLEERVDAIEANYVTTNTNQEITGQKTFVGRADYTFTFRGQDLQALSKQEDRVSNLSPLGLGIYKYSQDVGVSLYYDKMTHWVTEDSEVDINYPQIGGTFAVQSNNSKSYDLNDYVTLANQQTITGTKSFSAGTTVFGGTYNAVTGTHIQNGSIWFRTGDNFSYKGISTPENKISFFKSFNENDARSAYIDFNAFTRNASVSLSYQSDSTKSANLNDYSTLTDLSEATSLSTTVAIDTLFA